MNDPAQPEAALCWNYESRGGGIVGKTHISYDKPSALLTHGASPLQLL